MILTHCPLEGRTGHEAAWALLRQTYLEETGEALPPIGYGSRGKPDFLDCPWHFSLSHTSRHAFCALSRHPIGLDAEELDRRCSPRLAQRVLSPGELAQYAAAPDPGKALLSFWVLKEAQVKLTGEGLQGFPNHTDFTLPHPAIREIDGCLVAILEENEEDYAV